MDTVAWSERLPALKRLLRWPVETSETGVRGQYSDRVEIVHQEMADVLFGRDRDWTDRDDRVLAEQCAGRIADSAESTLFGYLDDGRDDDSLIYLAEVCVPAWREAAQPPVTPVRAAPAGLDNGGNWGDNRIPGTLYYLHDGTAYRYADQPDAAPQDWRTIEERQRQATDRAQPWGAGWYTPAGADPRYGGHHVFAVDRAGPWQPRADVERALNLAAAPVITTVDEPQQSPPAQSDATVVAPGWDDPSTEPDDAEAEGIYLLPQLVKQYLHDVPEASTLTPQEINDAILRVYHEHQDARS